MVKHDGEIPNKDENQRLQAQLEQVKSVMKDGAWYHLAEICERIGASTASVSARIRDFRKDQFGGHTVNRRYVGQGLFKYQLVVNEKSK